MKQNKDHSKSASDSNFLKILYTILCFFIFLYFYKLGSIGLIDVDEPRYAEAAREMLESSNWVVPYFNYLPRYDKPIFFYWLEAISMKIFGINEFSARLPSAILALTCSFMVFYLLKTLYGLVCALLGALVLLSTFEIAALARFSIPDMTLCSFISSSIISFFLGYNEIIKSGRFFKLQISKFTFWYLIGFFFLVLACLTKGPVGLVIIFMVLFPFFWWVGSLDYFLKNYSFWIGFLLFLLIVLPWYVIVHFATNGEFTNAFFGFHNFNRYTSVVSGHEGSIFYFVPVIIIGFLPWVFFLPQAINSILQKGLKSLLDLPENKLPWFCLWWFIIVFVFFSLSKTKLLTYILSVFPALSIIVTLYFKDILNRAQSNRGLVIGFGVFFLFCLIVFYIVLFNLELILPREIKSLKLDFQITFFAFLMLVGVSMAWASSNKDERVTVIILLSTFLCLYYSLVSFLLPKIDKHSQYLLRTFSKSIGKDVNISTYQIIKPSITFYAKRQIKKIDHIKKLQKKLNQPNKFAFVTKKKLLEGINLENAYFWGNDSRYVFYTNYPINK